MEEKKRLKLNRGFFRNFGWKKNLLAVLVSFALCMALEQLTFAAYNVRILANFDFSIAVIPLLGFMLGIWGVIGVMANALISSLSLAYLVAGSDLFTYSEIYITYFVGALLCSALPSILWYSVPLKGEKRVSYPRLDTTAHVIKYYVIMVVTVACYAGMSALTPAFENTSESWLLLIASFTQYLDVILIVGMPLVIIVSRIRYRTITINERMVLAFLNVGVIASLFGAALVYLNSYHLEPSLFRDYEKMMTGMEEFPDNFLEIVERYQRFWSWFYVHLAFMLNSLLIIEILFMRTIEKKVTRPILHLAGTLEQYTKHEQGTLDSETVKTRCRPYRCGYGEISSLTGTCVEMVGEIDNYTENLKEVTAEKERIGTELDVASKIQKDMLPKIFPPFPDRHEIELYASMTPAKEVGGDFYDFYFTDHDHLALTIADVSGKGVPAALFMVISKTLLKNHAQTGCSPKEILSYANHQLCQGNDSFMFCTVWMGILDLRTGILTAANAGHEYPAVRRSGGQYELMRDQHDPPLGVRDGFRYHEYELKLEAGDFLFEYTDGVTEATDADYNQFGEERVTQVLNAVPGAAPDEQIRSMHDAIHAFVKDEPQFDDITMLCIQYNGRMEKNYDRLTVPARVDRMDEVTDFVRNRLAEEGCPEDIAFSIVLAAEEIYVNIASYAYEGKEGDAVVEYSFEEADRTVQLVFSDQGTPFNPLLRQTPDITAKAEDRPIGGLGIHIVKKTMDEVLYDYEGGGNRLTIRKRISAEED